MAEITRLRQLLKHVGLHNLASLTFELKEESLNSLDYLELLLTKEIQMRDSKNIYKRTNASNLPNKTFKDFEIKEAKGITQWQIDKITTKTLDYIKECQLIIIDEFAYTKLNDSDSQVMYHYLTKINRTKSLIIITNKTVNEIPNSFNEKLLATTLMDRLTENSQLIHLAGESYRQKNHNKLF